MHLVVMVRKAIEGNEESLFDLKTQTVVKDGYRIIDKSLRVNPAHSPPVMASVLYREKVRREA